jgi:hypothetical protein
MSNTIDPVHPCTWKVDDVERWARSVKLSETTITILKENDVDGPTLATLSQDDIKSELGIRSLPARRYLYDLIRKLRAQQDSANLVAAVEVHSAEIENLKNFSSPDASGGVHPIDNAVIEALANDAEIQRQILDDHLLSLRLEAGIAPGEQGFADSELAVKEQQRINELLLISEFDHRYARTLQNNRNRNDNNIRQQEIRSLFSLAVETCSANRINVATAVERAEVRIFHPDQLPQSEDEEDVLDEPYIDEEEKSWDDGCGSPALQIQDLPQIERCNVCYEENIKGVLLACDHPYCVPCLRNLFQTVLADSSLLPIRCCEIEIDTSIALILLSRKDSEALIRRIDEFEAKNKMYCPTCGTFVNLDHIDQCITEIFCDCGVSLCVECKTQSHPYVSCHDNRIQQNDTLGAVLELAQEQGWKRCPSCQGMIEFTSGCNHMTCRCGYQFCYLCLAPWNGRSGLCSSGECQLWDEDRLVAAAEIRVEQRLGNRVVDQDYRDRLFRREVDALENHEVCTHVWRRQNLTGECERCQFALWMYGMVCHGGCRATVCYTCAQHRLPRRGWR